MEATKVEFAALSKQDPPNTAWTLFPKNGLGTLNLQTPELTAQAAKLVKTGRQFPLNWKLELPFPPLFHRAEMRHEIVHTVETPSWDSPGHFGGMHGCHFEGLKPADVPTDLGVARMARKGISGRAVLIDYRRWALKNGITYSPGSRHEITVENIKAVAKDQKVEFKTGDILLLRSGWTEWYESLTTDERVKLASDPTGHEICGVKNNNDTLEFLWNNHFSAVAGDTVAFEAVGPDVPSDSSPWLIHLTILSGWGCPIGEMWYLDELAAYCAETGVYEMFITSAPLNKEHGIASPPNALAIL
ncbi:arylformamidase [Synchytrium microbalum]|uniref:Arylformamidase n=1 Tax=Synchytrium microbalum TaxID=1806994 RepID=A0A507CCH7_9FUNG|nr:arylformamidase [Synchytrium microbalum]TPX35736.1 arylformamidase [Synchytrium microbalum]